MSTPARVLVTGVTGYVGGQLVPQLLQAGYPVRVMARDPQGLQGRSWVEQVEIVQGDVLEPATLSAALVGVDVAYYLIHSILQGANFHQRDLIAARSFGQAAKAAGVSRIIYLGGLGDPTADLSMHLRSRQQTGQALAEAGVPVTEFRAAIIVGAGSVSFEMIRYLTERVPIMICPSWTSTRVQPIAISDVLNYLAAAIAVPASTGKIIEVGGADILTYGGMMLGYARARGLHRRLVPVPVLSPRLSSYWVHWVTPIPAEIARPLIEGLRNEVIVHTPLARALFPAIHPLDYRAAVEVALVQLRSGDVETMWSDALVTSRGDVPAVAMSVEVSERDGMLVERRQRRVGASADEVYSIFAGLGGRRGWLYANVLWRLRGELDRLIGGPGLRRGRRSPDDVRVGDAVDFWRVEQVEQGRLLRMRAEMKVPGDAWLQFEAAPTPNGPTKLRQTAYFVPKGLFGLLYWYALYPIHRLIFSGLIDEIARRAEVNHRLHTRETAAYDRPTRA
ncbi:MAG: SDR family oxidoreductase [Ktedonobacterales bacterium]